MSWQSWLSCRRVFLQREGEREFERACFVRLVQSSEQLNTGFPMSQCCVFDPSRRHSSNSYASGNSQNTGNVLTGAASSAWECTRTAASTAKYLLCTNKVTMSAHSREMSRLSRNDQGANDASHEVLRVSLFVSTLPLHRQRDARPPGGASEMSLAWDTSTRPPAGARRGPAAGLRVSSTWPFVADVADRPNTSCKAGSGQDASEDAPAFASAS